MNLFGWHIISKREHTELTEGYAAVLRRVRHLERKEGRLVSLIRQQQARIRSQKWAIGSLNKARTEDAEKHRQEIEATKDACAVVFADKQKELVAAHANAARAVAELAALKRQIERGDVEVVSARELVERL